MPINKVYLKMIFYTVLFMLVSDFLSIWLYRFVKTDADYNPITGIVEGADMPHSVIIPISVILIISVLVILFICSSAINANINKSYNKMLMSFFKGKVILFVALQYFSWYFLPRFSHESQVEIISPVQANNDMIFLILRNAFIFLIVMQSVFIIIVVINREKYKSEIVITDKHKSDDLLVNNIMGQHK